MFFSDAPKTKQEAEKHRYNTWAGNPKGTRYKSDQCAMEVWSTGRGALPYQCLRQPGFGPDNLYCQQHAKKLAQWSKP